jgi:zinc/manganese transport system substrate-binding protein
MKKLVAITAVSLLALAGCSTPAGQGDEGLVNVVASTSVYGDIAAAVGGDHVTVTSLIDDSAVDPHSFEASARDQLAISEADLIIENGGGYDPFIDSLIEASGSTAAVLSAVDVSELLEHDDAAEHDDAEHDDADAAEDDGHGHIEGFNEHVWYSLHGMSHVVEAVVEQLSSLDEANATTYRSNGDGLVASIEQLEARAVSIGEGVDDGHVAVTEPVPVYLLAAAGLENVTPDDFTEAIEEGNDVPPLALQSTLALLSSKSVLLLAYNSQTASPETERVHDAAEEAGIPIVEFTETLPAGADYVSWMTANLDALATALGQ